MAELACGTYKTYVLYLRRWVQGMDFVGSTRVWVANLACGTYSTKLRRPGTGTSVVTYGLTGE